MHKWTTRFLGRARKEMMKGGCHGREGKRWRWEWERGRLVYMGTCGWVMGRHVCVRREVVDGPFEEG